MGEITTDYDNFSETFSHSRRKLVWAEIDYFLQNYIFTNTELPNTHGYRVLDVGCGSGRLLSQFTQFSDIQGLDYYGVDLSIGMIQEAKKQYPYQNFLVLDMLDLNTIHKKFDYIFFIASFHHLRTIQDREKVLYQVKQLLNPGGKLFMTNWSLESDLNKNRYTNKKIENSINTFGSSDFSIKIGEFERFYHSFSLSELHHLFTKSGFIIIENREFENQKNIISIISH